MRQVLKKAIFLPALLLLIFLPHSVLAETKTLKTTQDTYANQAYPDKNYATTGSVVLSNKYTTRLGFVQFEHPNLPAGATIDQAVLKIYVHELHYADTAKLNVGPMTVSWSESTVTWNNKPTIDQSQATENTINIQEVGW